MTGPRSTLLALIGITTALLAACDGDAPAREDAEDAAVNETPALERSIEGAGDRAREGLDAAARLADESKREAGRAVDEAREEAGAAMESAREEAGAAMEDARGEIDSFMRESGDSLRRLQDSDEQDTAEP